MTLVPSADDRTGDVTLLFTLGAARSFADPPAVFADARRWSRYVGLISNDTAAVDAFARRHGVENDFELRNWDKWGTMEAILEATDTPRHVLVGTKRQDRRLAGAAGWEYRTAREAAEKADWELGDPDADGSDDDARSTRRFRRALRDRWFWPF